MAGIACSTAVALSTTELQLPVLHGRLSGKVQLQMSVVVQLGLAVLLLTWCALFSKFWLRANHQCKRSCCIIINSTAMDSVCCASCCCWCIHEWSDCCISCTWAAVPLSTAQTRHGRTRCAYVHLPALCVLLRHMRGYFEAAWKWQHCNSHVTTITTFMLIHGKVASSKCHMAGACGAAILACRLCCAPAVQLSSRRCLLLLWCCSESTVVQLVRWVV